MCRTFFQILQLLNSCKTFEWDKYFFLNYILSELIDSPLQNFQNLPIYFRAFLAYMMSGTGAFDIEVNKIIKPLYLPSQQLLFWQNKNSFQFFAKYLPFLIDSKSPKNADFLWFVQDLGQNTGI